MVFNQASNQELKEVEISKKILTCSELEEVNREAMKSVHTSTKNSQHDDSAVLFSSKKLTRYDTAELRRMQDSRLSKQKPPCVYDEKVIKLGIIKGKDGTGNPEISIADRFQMLQENLRSLAMQNWSPTIYQNYKSYHYALLNPNNRNLMGYIPLNRQNVQLPQQTFESLNQTMPLPQTQQEADSSSRRRVSFDLGQQKAALDKILPYDRKTVFFDTLTTSTMMRPPPPKMSNPNQQGKRNNFSRHPQRNTYDNMFKKNPAGNYSTCEDRNVSRDLPTFTSPGYFARNDSITFNNNMENKKNVDEEENKFEGEPEWFSFPATRHDFVDLHGFDEEQETALKSSPKKNNSDQAYKNNGNNKYQRKENANTILQRQKQHYPNNFYDENCDYVFPNPHNTYFNNNSRANHHYNNQQNYSAASNYLPAENYLPVNNNQRFRNPLHHSKTPSPKTPTLPSANLMANFFAPSLQRQQNFQPINPLYEAWKACNMMEEKGINFTQLIEIQQANNRQMIPTMKLMSDIEQGIIQKSQSGAEVSATINTNNIQQFFQNFSGVNQSPNTSPNVIDPQQRENEVFPVPTPEQLHKHTSEILRKAILRNREQQYHDENNNQQ